MPPKDSVENHTGQADPSSVSETQFKKLVEVISRSQHNYRELIDHLDQAVFTITLDGEVRVANRRLAEICNVSFIDLIGHRLSEFVETPAPTVLGHTVSEFVKTGSWEGTVPVRLKNRNRLRYFDCRLQALAAQDQDRLVTGWARDVTAQYESEIRFAELFESLPEGVYFATSAGKILDANAAMVRLFGFDSKEDLKARNLRELYQNPAEHDAPMREIESKGSFHNRELHFQRKDGKAIHCLVSAFGIRDTFGRIARLQGHVVDNTEGRQIEKQLRQEQEVVRCLVASFPDLITVVDRDGRLSYVSPSVKDILGGTPREYIGERFESRADPEDRGRLADTMHRIMAGEESRAQIEFRSRHANGTQKTLRASAGPLFDEEGKIAGVVASACDVTESKIVEEQFAQKEKFAAMGQMMAGAAHELNNPLTAILGIAELLRERTVDEADRRHLDVVLLQTRRAAGIVQNLLAFSHPSARGHSKVNLEEIVGHALQLERTALSQKNISVKFETPGNIPPIDGDQKLLTQVFLNIITNAEQAISADRDYGILTVSLSRHDGRVSVVIADDGPGISPENLGRIFDPFFTTKRPGGGSGLGLAICRAVVKEHGGMIDVESMPGFGTAFQILLSISADAPSETAQLRPAAEVNQAGVLAGHTVLVVDDEESIREIVQVGLSARGLKVHTAESSETALSCLAANAYEVVVCDFNLPGLSGEQLFERLRKQRAGAVPHFIFMTGELVDSDRIAEIGQKGASVLQKPFQVKALANLLAETLHLRPFRAH